VNQQVPRKFAGTLYDLQFGQLLDPVTGLQEVPSSVSVEFRLNNATIFAGAGSINVDSAGAHSYEWLPAESSQVTAAGVPAFDHRAYWTFVVAGETIERLQWFDVPFARLITRVNDTAVVREYPQLHSHRQHHKGPVGSLSTLTTIVDDRQLKRYPSNYWNGALLRVNGAERTVVQYDQTTATLTLDSALIQQPTITYELEESYQYYIDMAWQELQSRLRVAFGRNEYARLLDGEDLTECHLALSCHHACRSRVGENMSLFKTLSEEASVRFDGAWSRLRTKMDSSLTDQLTDQGDPAEVSVTETAVASAYWGA
jgi:hypothetical protein